MSPEGAIQKSIIAMACVAPAGAPFYSDPYRGFAALTPGYFLSPLRGFKKYAALGVSPALFGLTQNIAPYSLASGHPAGAAPKERPLLPQLLQVVP